MALPKGQRFSYSFADYLTWDGEGRIEIMDGQIIKMEAPSTTHQRISRELTRQFANFLEGKTCEVFAAPFAVRLFEEENDSPMDVQTVFEPDLTIICDKRKIDEHGCKGAPDMIIEILSPSTVKHDLLFKMIRYYQAGVREYWIVSPKEQTIQVYQASDNNYVLVGAYTSHEIAQVNVLDGCFIDLSKVFAE